MSWRKWLVRGLVFSIVGSLACAGWLYQRWTNPAAVRQQVIAKLQAQFPAAGVALESARLRILGGIALTELRLVRRDDPTRTDFAYIPSAVVYHDKEQLLDGRLAFLKVELHRPRLRVARAKDGRWNWADLLGPVNLQAAIPTLVIEDGTLLLEDQVNSAATPLEITNVHLTVINDPLSTVTVEGVGHSETVGKLELRATWQRDSHQVSAAVKAVGMPVTAGLLARFCPCSASERLHGLSLEGRADLQADLSYQPAATEPFSYDLRCQLHQVKLRHPKVPLFLEQLEATARCHDGWLTVDKLAAASGTAQLEGKGTARLPCIEQNFEALLSIQHLPLSSELSARLPENLQKLYEAFQPSGPASVQFDWCRQNNQWQRRRCVLHPEETDVCYHRFPYRVERLTGSLDYGLGDLVKIDLTGYTGPQPVLIQGSWKGTGVDADVKIDVLANGVPLEERLLAALPASLQGLATSFHARGRGDFKAFIRHAPGSATYANEYHARFYDAAVQWDGFPYPLEKVSGFLKVHPDRWQFHDFRGTHNGSEVLVSGHSGSKPAGKAETPLVIDIVGRNVGIDGDLRQALHPLPGLAKAWDGFGPTGRMNFKARVDRLINQPQDLDISVDVHGCAIRPRFFRYTLEDLSGVFHYTRNRLELTGLKARNNDTHVSIAHGMVDLSPGGGFYADLQDVRGDPIVLDEEFRTALPKCLQAAAGAVKSTEPIAVQTRLVVAQDEQPGSPPDIYWDGQLWLRNTQLRLGLDLNQATGTVACVGRYNGRQLQGLSGNCLLDEVAVLKQPFRKVLSNFQVKENTPGVLLLGLRAPLFNGDISGQGRVEFGSSMRYELNLTASQVNLAEFGQHNLGPKSELSGAASGRLVLTGQGDGVSTLDGNGSLHVPSGRLYNLPLLLDLLKFLGLRWPDRTAFEEAHADFSIHGNRVSISRLDLWGNAISLAGQGDINLDGSDVQLDFYPSWARVEQLLPPAIRNVPPAVSKGLLKIEVRGKVGGTADELKFHKKPMPILVDPLLQIRDFLANTQKK